MTAEKPAKPERILSLRDLAVAAAMHRGSFEASGETRLVVLRDAGLMIAYRTPFNPLPKLTEAMKFDAALRGKSAYREPYGIEIWHEKAGKVLSIGWRDECLPVVDHFDRGLWEQSLAELASHDGDAALCRKCSSALSLRKQPVRGEDDGRARTRKRAQISGRAGRDG
jgi:hypothetical protein